MPAKERNPQFAFYELSKRRVPVSMLPGFAKLLGVSLEALIADDEAAQVAAAPPRRTRRGPISKLEQQLDVITRLPKAEQRFVSKMLDIVLAEAGAGREVATAP